MDTHQETPGGTTSHTAIFDYMAKNPSLAVQTVAPEELEFHMAVSNLVWYRENQLNNKKDRLFFTMINRNDNPIAVRLEDISFTRAPGWYHPENFRIDTKHETEDVRTDPNYAVSIALFTMAQPRGNVTPSSS
jgi:hypothetical protein